MISTAATPVAGRAGGQASSSRLAHAAKALSSARSAADSGGVVAIAVVLLVTGASDQRRRLRSAARTFFFGAAACATAERAVSFAEMPWSSSPYDAAINACSYVKPNAIDASTTAVGEPAGAFASALTAAGFAPAHRLAAERPPRLAEAEEYLSLVISQKQS